MGFDAVVFTKLGAGPGGVEVAEGHEFQAVEVAVPGENPLEHELGLAVGIDRPLRQCLVHGHLFGDAVGGAGGAEDEFPNPMGHTGVEQVDARSHVVAEVLGGIGHRLAHQRVCGKVDDGLGLDLADDRVDEAAVAEIPAHERGSGIYGGTMAFGEIVEDRDRMSGIQKLFDADRTDVSSPAGNKNVHGSGSMGGWLRKKPEASPVVWVRIPLNLGLRVAGLPVPLARLGSDPFKSGFPVEAPRR